MIQQEIGLQRTNIQKYQVKYPIYISNINRMLTSQLLLARAQPWNLPSPHCRPTLPQSHECPWRRMHSTALHFPVVLQRYWLRRRRSGLRSQIAKSSERGRSWLGARSGTWSGRPRPTQSGRYPEVICQQMSYRRFSVKYRHLQSGRSSQTT